MKNIRQRVTNSLVLIITSVLLAVNIHVIIARFPHAQEFSEINNTNLRTHAFIAYLTPMIRVINKATLKNKRSLAKLHRKYQQQGVISYEDYLHTNYTFQSVKSFNPKERQQWRILLKRTDAIPVSVVLAEAIFQSNSGKDPMLIKSRNVFNGLCYRAACGMHLPNLKAKFPLSNPQLTKYNSIRQGISAYFRAVNRSPYYQDFRSAREKLREQNRLNGYRVLGCDGKNKPLKSFPHTRQLCQIIKKYDLTKYDRIKK